MFFSSPQGKVFLATISIVAPVSSTAEVFSSPKTDTYPKHQVCRSPRATLFELGRTGNFEPLLAQFLRYPHEAGTFTGVRLVPIFVGTLSSLFLLSMRVGTGRGTRVLLPTRGLRIGPHIE